MRTYLSKGEIRIDKGEKRQEGWVLVCTCDDFYISSLSDTYLIDVDHIDQPIDGYLCKSIGLIMKRKTYIPALCMVLR
jgi:hypothetical protein